MALIEIKEYHHHECDPAALVNILAGINQLKELIMATNEETLAALNAIKADLAEAGEEFTAKLEELVVALQGTTSPAADALIAELGVMAQGLADKV